MLILFVSPNSALDRVALAAGARAGGTVRASTVLDEAGGKTLHAARVAAALGADARVIAPLGGVTGDRVHELLQAEGIPVVRVPIREPTRRTYTVVDDEAADVVEVIEPSPRLADDEQAALRRAIAAGCADASLVVWAGSLPAGVSRDFGPWLVETSRSAGARSLVDTSGEALHTVLAAAPDLVMPNVAEAAEAAGLAAGVGADTAAAALCRHGARAALVTAGADGAALAVAREGHLDRRRFGAPRRRAVNAVGCGDAVLGGVASALAGGLSIEDAVVVGLAAAADKVGRLEGGRVERAGVEAAMAEVTVGQLERDPGLSSRHSQHGAPCDGTARA